MTQLARSVLRRTGAGVPLLVRLVHLVLAVATSALIATAVPSDLPLTGFTVVVAVVGLVSVLDTTGGWSTATLVLLVVEYLAAVASARTAFADLGVLAALAAGVYLVHATGALAAVLAPRTVVAGAVVLRWVLSTAAVLLAGLPVVAAVALVRPAGGGSGWLAVGVLGTAALLLLPSLAFRRTRD